MSTIDKPIWLLDVDGVLNIDRSPWHEAPRRGDAYCNGRKYRIRWSPTLIERIRAIIKADTATVIWCTTWCDAADQIERLFNFPVLRRAFHDKEVTNDRKFHLAWAIARSGCRLIWTDDLAVPEPGAAYDEVANKRTLLIKPASNRGLTPEDMDRIEAFIG